MIKKLLLCSFVLFLMNAQVLAKDVLKFEFPNEGWHKIDSPDGFRTKKCFVPDNQSSNNYTQMLMFYERKTKTEGISPLIMLHKQLGKDKNNYKDISPQYVLKDENNAMAIWCSELRNTCSVIRTLKGNEGVVFAVYINKMPHYSQNMFGQWANILAQVKIYDRTTDDEKNLIELD